jgi:type VI secretion system protein ImpL
VAEDLDARSAEALAGLLRAPIRSVWGSMVVVAQGDLDRDWKSKVIHPYNEALAGRFPFALDGRDAPMNDVADFFRLGSGTIWVFIDNDLRPFLDRKGGTWEPRQWLGIGMEFSAQFFAAIDRSRQISSSLFTQGETRLGMSFSVYPYPSTMLSESTLSVDGEHYRYRNGPQEWHSFAWPGPNPSARVRGVRADTHSTGEISADGSWAWLRLLSKAQIKYDQDNSFIASWSLRDTSGQFMTIRFRVRADRYNNPFRQGTLQGYRLPANIFERGDRATASNSGRLNPG